MAIVFELFIYANDTENDAENFDLLIMKLFQQNIPRIPMLKFVGFYKLTIWLILLLL